MELQSLGSVVKILGTDPFEHLPHYIVMKNAGRSLDTYMMTGNDEIRKSFIPKILEAMMSIHNAGYAHNDVKPSNIIIYLNAENGMYSAIFCDFDQSYKFRSVIDFCGFTAGN